MNFIDTNTLAKLTLALALVVAPACDEGGEKKTDDEAAKAAGDKTDDKAAEGKAAKADHEAAKADHEAADSHAGHGAMDGAKPEASEVASLEGDGRVEINVDAGGYHPAQIEAPAKSKLTLAFKRTTEAGCGQELVLASLDIKKELPLNEAVEIEVEVPESGEVGFACGMNMYKGKVVPKS